MWHAMQKNFILEAELHVARYLHRMFLVEMCATICILTLYFLYHHFMEYVLQPVGTVGLT
jgi:hypothetical protein